MKLISSALLVLASLIALQARAATRPHYGGVLQVQVHAQLARLESADANENWESGIVREELIRLVYDRLTTFDENGRLWPQLALSWQHSPDYRRWTFLIRRNVELHDGSLLTSQYVATALAEANRTWHLHASGDTVTIDLDSPLAQMPEMLASGKNSIFVRRMEKLVGSGPFRLDTWQPGHMATFVAHDQCWRGRPFVDGIQVQMGLGSSEQLSQMEAHHVDVAEVSLDQLGRAQQSNLRVGSSQPQELYLLLLNPAVSKDLRLRDALSAAIDRNAIETMLLQRDGVAAASLLPQWITGYASLFSSARDLRQAQELRRALNDIPLLNLAYDNSDPLARTIAERIALNARDAGIVVRPASGEGPAANSAEIRLVKIALLSPNPVSDLQDIAAQLGADFSSLTMNELSDEQLYEQEYKMLKSLPVVPVAHVARMVAISPRVHDWSAGRDGLWRLENVWIEARP